MISFADLLSQTSGLVCIIVVVFGTLKTLLTMDQLPEIVPDEKPMIEYITEILDEKLNSIEVLDSLHSDSKITADSVSLDDLIAPNTPQTFNQDTHTLVNKCSFSSSSDSCSTPFRTSISTDAETLSIPPDTLPDPNIPEKQTIDYSFQEFEAYFNHTNESIFQDINQTSNSTLYPTEIPTLDNNSHSHSQKSTTLPNSVKSIILTGQSIKYFPLDILSNHVFIVKLDLSRNHIKHLPTELGVLTNLSFLNLRDNQLCSLPPSLKKLCNLEVLDLANNSLTDIDDLIFERVHKLRYLDISHNNLKKLPLSICFSFKTLLFLGLRANPFCIEYSLLINKYTAMTASLDLYAAKYNWEIDSKKGLHNISSKEYNYMENKASFDLIHQSRPLLLQILGYLHDLFDLKYVAEIKHATTKSLISISDPVNIKLSNDKRQQLLLKRANIIKEIQETEKTYVEQLHLVLNIYSQPLKALDLLISENFYYLFCNLDSIFQFHNDHFLPALLACSDGNIGRVFKKYTPYLKMYEEYCNNFDNANNLLMEAESYGKHSSHSLVRSNNKISLTRNSAKRLLNFIKLAKAHPQHSQLNLQSFLILPVQRLPRYKLLFQQILQYTPLDHPDYEDCNSSQLEIENRLLECNEKKRQKEDEEIRKCILSKINPSGGNINLFTFTLKMKFIKEGQLQLLKCIELRPSARFPLLDPIFACNGKKTKYSQHLILNLWETVFGNLKDDFGLASSRSKAAAFFNSFGISGKSFYFYKFNNAFLWCKKRVSNHGERDLICALSYSMQNWELMDDGDKARIKIVDLMQDKSFVEKYVGFLAGIASGSTKLLVGHPFDTIKIRLQVEGGYGRFKGPLDCIYSTIQKEGFLALYKGASPPLFGWILMDSIGLGALNNFKLILQDGDSKQPLKIWQHVLAGIWTGWTVSFIANPIEVVKARLQVQYDSSTKLYNGPVDCIEKIYKQNGIRGLYSGLSGCLIFRSFFGVLWGSYEVYNQILLKYGMSQTLIPFISGGLAANTFWMIAFPADVVKNRMMALSDKNPEFKYLIKSTKLIYQREGLGGFYRGFIPCFLRSFPTNGAAIFVYESVMSKGRNWIYDV